ncbi:MAG: hypothetical protein AAB699_03250 [Patescibacteria group bacterium]
MSEDRDIFLAAHLGSEVARLLAAKGEHNEERMRGAYERACGIIEELKMNTNPGGKSESAILRDILDDLMRSSPVLSIRPEAMTAYFLPFAHKVLGI